MFLLLQFSFSILSSGYYCEGGVSNYTDYPCPTGHYCLDGTSDPNQYKCPKGKFMNVTGATAEADCFDCTRKLVCRVIDLCCILEIVM